MFNKINFLFVVFLLVMSQTGVAQVDLKKLRSKPDTNIVERPQAPVSNLQEVMTPIPKLGLEVDYWKHWTKFGLNLSQAYFNDYWNSGGVNSIAILGTAWHKSEYIKNNFNFVTEIDLRYGRIQNDFLDKEVQTLSKKNVDRIFWDNKLGYKLSKNWGLFFSFTFESQFDAGYSYTKNDEGAEIIDTITTNFMAPGYFTESFGLEYSPDKTFSLRFGTGTARQTLILDDRLRPLTGAQYYEKHGKYLDEDDPEKGETRAGVEPGKRFQNDLAFQITANLDRNLSKNLNIKSRYNLFADYTDINDPAHRLDVTLSAKIASLVNVSLTGIIAYNSVEQPGVQVSQALSMGLTYTLPR